MRMVLTAFSALLAGVAILFALACWAVPVRAQEHDHGKGNIPNWYDPACCSQRDCKPVEDDDIEFYLLPGGGLAVRYKVTGNIFQRHQFKLSQDERYHVCIMPGGTSLCFYDRSGV